LKVRIKVPEELAFTKDGVQDFVDDILLWGMEIDTDIEFYSYWYPEDHTYNDRRRWAVFSVDTDSWFMFALKWGALQHKSKKKQKSPETGIFFGYTIYP
jgi:hypothetical protein